METILDIDNKKVSVYWNTIVEILGADHHYTGHHIAIVEGCDDNANLYLAEGFIQNEEDILSIEIDTITDFCLNHINAKYWIK